jgi:hypothetical protein
MLAHLRRLGLTKGLLGGSRPWLVLGALAWGLRAAQWALRRPTDIVFDEPLLPGERLLITHGQPPSRRRRSRPR